MISSVHNATGLRPGFWLRFGVLVLGLAAGCGRDGVQVYRVPKESGNQQLANQSALPAGHPDTAGAGPKVTWHLPAGWQEVPPGEMRLASFRVAGADGKQADVSVVPLPGLAGADLDNVNRWRGQVGQSPVSEEELAKLQQPVPIADQVAQLYDQAGQSPGSGDATRILAAILRKDGVAWFFKMTGDDGLVAQQKPAFVDFLKSISFAAATALPPSHPPLAGSGGEPADSVASPDRPTWQVPSAWKEAPAGQFLVAKYVIGAEKEEAAVNVSRSAGDGGGVAGNVNRWRRQLGLGELAGAELEKELRPLELASGKATLVDFTGTDPRSGQKSRLVGVIVPRPGQTWFYKLMGQAQAVEQAREIFTQFVRTAQYGS